jgi:hypothetical protein
MLSFTVVAIEQFRDEIAAFEWQVQEARFSTSFRISFPTSMQNPCL